MFSLHSLWGILAEMKAQTHSCHWPSANSFDHVLVLRTLKGVYGPLTSSLTLLASTARAGRAPPQTCNLASRRRSSKGCDWSTQSNPPQNLTRFKAASVSLQNLTRFKAASVSLHGPWQLVAVIHHNIVCQTPYKPRCRTSIKKENGIFISHKGLLDLSPR